MRGAHRRVLHLSFHRIGMFSCLDVPIQDCMSTCTIVSLQELNAGFVENNLMSQIRTASVGQIIPLIVHRALVKLLVGEK